MKTYLRLLSFLLLVAATPAYACWDGAGNCVRNTGVFTGANAWVNTRDAGRAIRADDHDTHDESLATGIETAVARDGQNTPTANLPMGGFRHTGVGDASASDHYGVVGQIQDGDYVELGSVAGTDTITGSASPAISAYAAGQVFRFVAAGTNTGAATLNINSVGAKAIQKLGAALVAGDITSGDGVLVLYDGTQFQMLTPARTPVLTAGAIDATDLATDSVAAAEIAAGAVDTAELAANAVTLAKLEDSSGTVGQVYTIDSAGTAAEWATPDDPLTEDTAQSGTGTDIGFTSVPAGTKRATVMITSLSTDGTNVIQIRLADAGGTETTGYIGTRGTSAASATVGTAAITSGFDLNNASVAANSYGGVVELVNIDGNTWVASGVIARNSGAADISYVAGQIALDSALTGIHVVAGGDTFDGGTVNVQYLQ